MNRAKETSLYNRPTTVRLEGKYRQILVSISMKHPQNKKNLSAAIGVALEEWEANNIKRPRCTRCKLELEEVSRGRWSCPICDPSRQ